MCRLPPRWPKNQGWCVHFDIIVAATVGKFGGTLVAARVTGLGWRDAAGLGVLGDGQNMKEGTAAGIATLGLMKQFDTQVMVKGYQFLLKITPAAISTERFPYYGHFYGCMGMYLLGQEFKEAKEYWEKTGAYIAGVQQELLAWQQEDGSWPLKGWIKNAQSENAGYSTAFATLTLFVPEARLSIYKRTPPKLPAETKPGK